MWISIHPRRGLREAPGLGRTSLRGAPHELATQRANSGTGFAAGQCPVRALRTSTLGGVKPPWCSGSTGITRTLAATSTSANRMVSPEPPKKRQGTPSRRLSADQRRFGGARLHGDDLPAEARRHAPGDVAAEVHAVSPGAGTEREAAGTVMPQATEQPGRSAEVATGTECGEAGHAHARPGRISWARLLNCVVDIYTQHCSNRGGWELKIIAAILEWPVQARRSLRRVHAAVTSSCGRLRSCKAGR
jgi:hypothetical protein